jgi:magnesium chelatase family protein
MPLAHAHRWCALGPDARTFLERAIDRLGLSPRAYERIMRVARTIADLAGAREISAQHVSEAIGYRTLDRPADGTIEVVGPGLHGWSQR